MPKIMSKNGYYLYEFKPVKGPMWAGGSKSSKPYYGIYRDGLFGEEQLGEDILKKTVAIKTFKAISGG